MKQAYIRIFKNSGDILGKHWQTHNFGCHIMETVNLVGIDIWKRWIQEIRDSRACLKSIQIKKKKSFNKSLLICLH